METIVTTEQIEYIIMSWKYLLLEIVFNLLDMLPESFGAFSLRKNVVLTEQKVKNTSKLTNVQMITVILYIFLVFIILR